MPYMLLSSSNVRLYSSSVKSSDVSDVLRARTMSPPEHSQDT